MSRVMLFLNTDEFPEDEIVDHLRTFLAAAPILATCSMREAIHNVSICGQLIPAGTHVLMFPVMPQSNSIIWGKNPEKFDPDRWKTLPTSARDGYTFQAFNTGPRACLATMQNPTPQPEVDLNPVASASASSSSNPLPAHLNPANYPQTRYFSDSNIHLELTYNPLDPTKSLAQIRSPHAGANVLFLGTTRSTFDNRPVARLTYTSYAPLALRTLEKIARGAVTKYQLCGISISHRLGEVRVAEESIAIAVAAGHRRPAWRAGEEVLEECKAAVEIWKLEEFVGAGEEEGEWRANRDTDSQGNYLGDKVAEG
ncbi:molybdopterin synthase large subunit CnxH [Histoplasma capsulatum H143]|uniref:Molybdopterin synthase catalytic subunit n=1 Tax=Ajellomyces capsulatus (strain H143) TaxID=544712 RepID=C6HSA5_AJECH|nr:molybdopterin synthase large subunit CnxH [Histoplasma capsulatum H143]